jgi:hypothetical protein
MTVVSTLDVSDLTAPEYRAVMDELGVERRPEGGIYLHLTTRPTSGIESSRSGLRRGTSIGSSSDVLLRRTRRLDWTARRRSR